MRLLLIFIPFILASCALRVEQAALETSKVAPPKIAWPAWTPSTFKKDTVEHNPFLPNFIALPGGEIVTYSPRPDGTEHFAIISKREQNARPGIFQLRQCFLPTSIFAGPSPLTPHTNELISHDRKWIFPAYDYRSTFFDLYPACTKQAKGLLLYHSSIMLLSIAEKQVITNFRTRGWHVMVALPPDSLYRSKIPAPSSKEGTLQNAAQLVAEDMDRHYLEQGHTTRIALRYLAKTRPNWLTGKRVLMGTSAGTFGLPAEALMNPGWDALIFVSGGTNLLSLYQSGSAGLFTEALKWVGDARKDPPKQVSRIYRDEEYHEIYRRAATLTKYHSGALAPLLHDQRILTIAGTIDHIMPDTQAHGLHRALGSPERWTVPLGHHLIALQLILEVDRIDRWIMNP
ncbi:MAG: hypothetical protein ACJAVK_000202 [Akkermansiaceae bacterium]